MSCGRTSHGQRRRPRTRRETAVRDGVRTSGRHLLRWLRLTRERPVEVQDRIGSPCVSVVLPASLYGYIPGFSWQSQGCVAPTA